MICQYVLKYCFKRNRLQKCGFFRQISLNLDKSICYILNSINFMREVRIVKHLFKYALIIAGLTVMNVLFAAQNALGQDQFRNSTPKSSTNSYNQRFEQYSRNYSASNNPSGTVNSKGATQAVAAENKGHQLTAVVSADMAISRNANGKFEVNTFSSKTSGSHSETPTLLIDPNKHIRLEYTDSDGKSYWTSAYEPDSEALKEFVSLLGEHPGDGNRSFSVAVKSSQPAESPSVETPSAAAVTASKESVILRSLPSEEAKKTMQAPPSDTHQSINSPSSKVESSPENKLIAKSVKILAYSEGYDPKLEVKGSGAVLGRDGNNYPVIATAGHLDGATKSKNLFIVEFTDKSRSLYRVAAGFLNDEGADLAILTYSSSPDEKIKKFTGAPLGSSPEDIKVGMPATRIGYPGDREFNGRVRVSSLKIKEGNSYLFDGEVKDEKNPSFGTIGGESGSPLFNKEGKLIGILSAVGSGQGGRYAGTYQINYLVNYLRGHGYIINIE